MHVVDHAPHHWYLLDDDGALLFDINCSAGSAGYSFLIRLDAGEEADFRSLGRDYLTELAKRIQDSQPVFPDGGSAWVGRALGRADEQRVHAAIMAWRRENRLDPP